MNNLMEHQYFATNPKTGKFMTVIPFDDCIEILQYRYEHMAEKLKNAYEENKHLRSEHYKDDTIRELKYEISLMKKEYHRGFPISKEQEIAIKKWTDNHNKEDHKGLYGCYSYHFYPTSIGTSGVIKCTCGAEFEFQELG